MLANTSPPPTLARLTTLKFSPLPPTRHQTSPLSSFPSSLNTRPLPSSSRHSFARRHSSLPRYCSLGAETHGGITAKLITRNVAISAKKSQTFQLPLMVKPPSESGSSRESVNSFTTTSPSVTSISSVSPRLPRAFPRSSSRSHTGRFLPAGTWERVHL